MAKRVYVVRENNEAVALIKAANAGDAIRHCVGDRFKATVASQDDLILYVRDGMEVVDVPPKKANANGASDGVGAGAAAGA